MAKSAGTVAKERAKSRWRSAALELAGQQHPDRRSTPHAGAQRFADIVGLVAAAKRKGLINPSKLCCCSAFRGGGSISTKRRGEVFLPWLFLFEGFLIFALSDAFVNRFSAAASSDAEGTPARRDSEGNDATEAATASVAAAATATAAERFPALWDGRRSSELQGKIRFADVTFRDPIYAQQVSGLLGATTTQRRHTTSPGETNPVFPPASSSR